jgi:hypothetical protein
LSFLTRERYRFHGFAASFQHEGRGPEFNPATDSIETRDLSGGFVTAGFMLRKGHPIFFPFTGYQVYKGGKKHERDARSCAVEDPEFVVEWQPNPNFELVVGYCISARRHEDKLRPDGDSAHGC